MTTDRIKEIQSETAYPDSMSVQQALLKVWNECQQEQMKSSGDIQHIIKCLKCEPMEYHESGIRYFKCKVCGSPMK